MKKQAKKKTLRISVEKVRELRPVDASRLDEVPGGLACQGTRTDGHTTAAINN